MIKKIFRYFKTHCFFYHKFNIDIDTGATQYMRCEKCGKRKIKQNKSGYKPVDKDYLDRSV